MSLKRWNVASVLRVYNREPVCYCNCNPKFQWDFVQIILFLADKKTWTAAAEHNINNTFEILTKFFWNPTIQNWAGEMAECARQTASLGTILSAAQRSAFKFSLRPEFENRCQLFFGAYKSAAIVFRTVFIIVHLFNTFDIIDICVLCVWHDSIKEIYIKLLLLLFCFSILFFSLRNSIIFLEIL